MVAGFYADPAVCDACLHLSAIESSGKAAAAVGIPVACGAILGPAVASQRLPRGHAAAIPGTVAWLGPQGTTIRVAGLVSKPPAQHQAGSQQQARPSTALNASAHVLQALVHALVARNEQEV